LKSAVFRVRKRYFGAIVRGEKKVEYRKDSRFWARRLVSNPQPTVAIFLCGRQVHRRQITSIEFIETPKGFSKQGRKDIPTTYCWAIHLGEEIKSNSSLKKCTTKLNRR